MNPRTFLGRRSHGHRWVRSIVMLLSLLPLACGGDKPAADEGKAGEEAQASASTPAKADDGSSPPEDAEADAADGGKAEVASKSESGQPPGEDGQAPDEAGEAEGPDGPGDEAAEAGAAEAGAAEAGAAEAGEAPPDPAALLKEVKSKKTDDEKALELLAQAEEAGAKPKELSKAAVDRGEALHATPERAAKFFVWAGEKDPKNPEPAWHLAKQAAMSGDVPLIKEHLKVVHERGGKKLLQQIEFDPMWEIVKDDPDVRALLQ